MPDRNLRIRSDGPVLVTGGGGFIGGHLIRALLEAGCTDVRAADLQTLAEWQQCHPGARNLQRDLRDPGACDEVCRGVAQIYHLAADMGGIGFIETFKTECMLSTLIDLNLLAAAERHGVARLFYASSACVYPMGRQTGTEDPALCEADAYPAMPEDGYGWQKLYTERLCARFDADGRMQTRVARYHNVYGPWGTFRGGREKAPAAICRKVAEARIHGLSEIGVWGDGEQTRSFLYIDDCIAGTLRLMESGVAEPLNIGSAERVTVNEMVEMVCGIAGVRLRRVHDLSAPQGVRGRSSDNTLVTARIGWSPDIRLRDGLERTYAWIHDQVAAGLSASCAGPAL